MVGDQMAKAKTTSSHDSKSPSSMSIETLQRHCYDLLVGMKEDSGYIKKYNTQKKETKEKLIPLLKALRTKLSRQGSRDGSTGWQQWFEENREDFGISLSTANRWCGDEPEDKKKYGNLDKLDGLTINGVKFTYTIKLRKNKIVGLELTPYVDPKVAAAAESEEQPVEKSETRKKAERACELDRQKRAAAEAKKSGKARLTHLGNPSGTAICNGYMKTIAKAGEEPTCPRCLGRQTETIIHQWFEQFKRDNGGEMTSGWFQKLLREFDEVAVPAHPEWYIKTVAQTRAGFEEARRSSLKQEHAEQGVIENINTLEDCPTEDESEGFELIAQLGKDIGE
jgi:hypothetical protein